jgi:hypothetical protein
MENIKVYLMKARMMLFGSTAEVCEAIGKQIDVDLANTSKPNDSKMNG